MELPEIIEAAGRYMDVAGVAVMVIGAVVSIPLALRGFRPRGQAAGSEPLSVYRSYRQLLGRSILLGLELLVAADIIRTVAVAPGHPDVDGVRSRTDPLRPDDGRRVDGPRRQQTLR